MGLHSALHRPGHERVVCWTTGQGLVAQRLYLGRVPLTCESFRVDLRPVSSCRGSQPALKNSGREPRFTLWRLRARAAQERDAKRRDGGEGVGPDGPSPSHLTSRMSPTPSCETLRLSSCGRMGAACRHGIEHKTQTQNTQKHTQPEDI